MIGHPTFLELAQGFGLVTPDPFSSRELGGVWARDYTMVMSRTRMGMTMFTPSLIETFCLETLTTLKGNTSVTLTYTCSHALNKRILWLLYTI